MALLPMLIQHLMTRGMRQEQKETMDLQQENMKLQQKQYQMNIKEKQQMIDYLNTLPPEWRASAQKHPLVTNLLMGLTNRGQEGQPQQGPQPVDIATGDIAAPTPQPQAGIGLTGQIAEGQMGLGSMTDILRDVLRKETGIGMTTERVASETLPHPETGQLMEVPMDRLGRPMWDRAQPAPIDVTWQEVAGPEGPVKTPLPTQIGTIPPQFGIPSAVKPDIRKIRGPRGEEIEERYHPFTGKVISETPTGAPKGMPAETAGRLALVSGGIKELGALKALVFNKDGTVNRANLGHAMLGTPRTKGRNIKNMLFRIIDPIMRAATGAAVPEPELRRYINSYTPNYMASDEEIMRTWEALGDFLRDYLTISDPTGELAKSLGSFEKARELPRRGGGELLQQTIPFKVGDHIYDVPKNEIDAFKKAFPNARRMNK